MPAILFGSIGSLADTSELQRRAFNEAFQTHGLNWNWDQATYSELIKSSGGKERIADVAASKGETVNAAAVHQTKSEIFQKLMVVEDIKPRAGVIEVIEKASAAGVELGFITTTSAENVAGLLAALEPAIATAHFKLILNRSDVADSKPSPEVYELALRELGFKASECVAVEDNVAGVASARAAGIACVATPGTNYANHDFSQATTVVDRLDFDALYQQLGA